MGNCADTLQTFKISTSICPDLSSKTAKLTVITVSWRAFLLGSHVAQVIKCYFQQDSEGNQKLCPDNLQQKEVIEIGW